MQTGPGPQGVKAHGRQFSQWQRAVSGWKGAVAPVKHHWLHGDGAVAAVGNHRFNMDGPSREGMDRCDRVEWKCALLPLDRPEDEPWSEAGVIGAVPSVKRGFTVTGGGFRTVT